MLTWYDVCTLLYFYVSGVDFPHKDGFMIWSACPTSLCLWLSYDKKLINANIYQPIGYDIEHPVVPLICTV